MGFIGQLMWSVGSFLIRYPYLVWSRSAASDDADSKAKREDILNVLRSGPTIHRGGIPENTIKAFRESKSRGASSVEVDLQFTKDGHPVLLHDDTVDRTSDGTGTLCKMTLEEVKRLDVGVKYGHPGVSVPTLEDTINAIKELDLFLFLEVKGLKGDTIPTLLNMFAKDESLYNRIAIISFFPDVIYKISLLDPRIKIGYTTRSTILSHLPTGEPRFGQRYLLNFIKFIEHIMQWMIKRYVLSIVRPTILLPHKNDIFMKRFDLEQHRKAGTVVLTWTVNDEKEQEHLRNVLQVPYMTDHAPLDN